MTAPLHPLHPLRTCGTHRYASPKQFCAALFQPGVQGWGGVLSNGLDKQVDSVQRRTTVARFVAVTGAALSVAASTLREHRERNAEKLTQDKQNLLFLRHQ